MAEFVKALPVWEAGKETELNYWLAFTAAVPAGKGLLRLTGSTAYAVRVNGAFTAYGPARACKGRYRVDELELKLDRTENYICIEVAGYNINSYEYIDQPSFLQAEIEMNGQIIAATGDAGFVAVPMVHHTQKVQRYSFQRPATEYYVMGPSSLDYRTSISGKGVELAVCSDEKKLLDRGVLYLTYERADAVERVAAGSSVQGELPSDYWEDRAVKNIGPLLKGFKAEDIPHILSREMQALKFDFTDCTTIPFSASEMKAGTAAIYRMDHNTAGLIGIKVRCKETCTVFLSFDEILMDGDIRFYRASTASIIRYDLEPGEYDLLSFEPYVAQYIKVTVLDGACELQELYMRQVVYSGEITLPETDNPNLKKIYAAAAESFRQNAVDVFMDCPHRERAGWLCDSFWTSRVEKKLTGNSLIEKNFLENFLIPDKFDALPEGMFPMCYPSDHPNGEYIPNWAMWLILELEEYLHRSGDRAMIDAYKEKAYKLIHFFDRFVNKDGLLEKLESWVFIEWSKSNDLVQDVNYPSNMLFAYMLEAVSRMYNDSALAERASVMKETIRKKSFNGEFFEDNAVYKCGRLCRGKIATESCQYYAFFTGTATPETYPELWKKLTTDFGPQRKETKAYPEVPFANAFIGNYLRLEILSRAGLRGQVLKEMEGYFTKMADLTGTLWEHDGTYASCDHGFASHVVVW